jgi:nitrogen fixation/metabolism regulation signal transduction histidine kinase
MTSTTRDADTAVLCGADHIPQIAHFYVDVAKGRLHCLNDVARRLRASGIPLLATDAADPIWQNARRDAVSPAALPAAVALREGRLAEAELVFAAAAQQERTLHCSATPLKDPDGRVRAIMVTVVCLPVAPDWSTLAGLAHDLRSPLQTMGLVRHILAFRTLAESQRQEALTRLGTAAERAHKMAQELLEWCRSRGAARQSLESDWFALEPFLREVLAEQVPSAGQKRIALATSLGPIRGWQVLADRARLARILTNLLTNAIRYTPANGRVELGAAWEDQEGERTLALEVHDTGAGISPEEQESIFQPFERGSNAREQDSGGSGIGLAVVDRLTQELGLRCEVQSTAGQGSQFRVYVPTNLLRMAPQAGS